jgi:hypothetical protein
VSRLWSHVALECAVELNERGGSWIYKCTIDYSGYSGQRAVQHTHKTMESKLLLIRVTSTCTPDSESHG